MKTIILDWNGPIVEADDYYEERSKRVAHIFEKKWHPGFVRYWKEYYQQLSSGNQTIEEYYKNVAWALGATQYNWKELDDSFVKGERLVDENTVSYLQALKLGNMKIAVASNYYTPWVVQVADREGITPYVDFFAVSDLFRVRKPEHQFFRKTAREIGIPVEHCLYVGDSICDLDAANELGMKTLFIKGEEKDPKQHPLITNLGEITNHL